MKLTAKTSDRVNSMNCSLVSGADTFEIRTPPKPFLCKGILGHFPSKSFNLRSPEKGFPTQRGQGSVSQSFIFFFINLEDSTVPTCFYIGVSNPVFVSSHKNFSAVASIQHFVLKKKLTRLIAKSSYQYICSYLRKVNIPHLRSYLN